MHLASPQFGLEILLAVFIAACCGNLVYVALRTWQKWRFEVLLVGFFASLFLVVISLFVYFVMGLWFVVATLCALYMGFRLHDRSMNREAQPLIHPDFVLPFIATSISLVVAGESRSALFEIFKALSLGFTNTSVRQLECIYWYAAVVAPNLAPLFFWLAQNTVRRSPLGRD